MEVKDLISFLESSKDFSEITESDLFSLDLKYATTDNFMNKNAYGSFTRAFLHKVAFEKLTAAGKAVQDKKPNYKLLIYDALRPRSAQRILWSFVEGTEKEKYVANPDRGSIHNYGFAVDLTVIDEQGRPLDMGAGFDDFREISQPDQEQRYFKSGDLTEQHLKARKLLRNSMIQAGFRTIAHEWWHFEALPREIVRSKYTLIE